MDLSPGDGHRGTLPVESQSRIFGSPEKHALAVISGLKACIRSKNAEQGRRIHADAAARGIGSNIFVASTLINMYCKCGSLIDARRVFDAVKSRSVVPWNVMILGYAENGDGALALDFLATMDLQGFSPDSQTIVAALKACGSLVSQEQGREIGGRTVKLATLEKAFAIHSRARGLIKNSFVASSLVDLYAKCGSMEDAERAFEGMDFRDVVSWNALMLGYAENGEEELAMEVLRAMELQGCQANSRSFVAALKACSGLGEKEAGIELDGVIVKVSSIEKGMALHSRAAKIGSDRDKFVASAAMDMYVKCGSMADAQRAFDRMASRDVVSWNALILGYAETNDRERSLELLQLMIQNGGCDPNSRTFLAALKACRSSQALASTKVIHGLAARRGSSEKDGVLANSLVDVYGKCGSLLDAHQDTLAKATASESSSSFDPCETKPSNQTAPLSCASSRLAATAAQWIDRSSCSNRCCPAMEFAQRSSTTFA
ncbi:pentatricopeptide repeat-containing protein At4g18520, chloroplastic-like [Selaginella moellendorffii]|uniref:pentatricopeptide repeat-containing protein At4g18520, chloroplastic-like n=1 Tax=Selaginella moellendorffii TaxID=88036 RepID=UPI000D1CE1C1|nr:pentatricopeptide repeat-containing protein At4g18520, chloroplastic-like [Selaginella moellendorffii]|eukprot:XP_024543377.1 pentatricopeptide repeat-containing protein At4g18520, chloroplastic-like [Selaginella moellendorffii]